MPAPLEATGARGFSAEQMRNASIIYQVGRQMGLGTRDIQIALITAMTESGMINVQYGDRDSLGLFQQRPSQGWGSPEQVTNPEYAARKFYTELTKLGSRRFQMDMGAAAQAVQRSAYPDRYATHLPQIRMLWPRVQQGAGDIPMTVDGSPYITDDSMPQVTPGQDIVGIPSASTMLGAWGMNSPQPVDPMDDAFSTFLGEGTNQYIQELSQTTGPFQTGVDGWRKAVIDAAQKAVGTPYAWGGNSLANGVDCSGLIQQAYAAAGLELPRVSYQQAGQGQRVGYGGLVAGDLVAWDNSSRNNGADHIAIYLGNGMIIEAPRPGLSVRIRKVGKNLDGGFGVHMNF